MKRANVRPGLLRGAIVLRVIVILAIGAMIAAVGVAAVVSRAMLHVPRKHTRPSAAAFEAAIIATDGAQLRGSWFDQGGESQGCVMVLHGLGESRAASVGYARIFQKAGYAVLTPDSRGHGESGGEYITYGILEKLDVKRWASWMREQGCRRIFGLGESLGAEVLIQSLPITKEFRAVVAESALADFRPTRIQRLQRRIHSEVLATIAVDLGLAYSRLVHHIDLASISPRHSIAATSTPVLLIHGMKDAKTPATDSQLLAGAAGGAHDLWLVPNAGHAEAASAAPDEFRRRVLDWFANH